MSANSKIEWTDHTFNPWLGCTKVSPACDHCYAEVSTPSRALGVVWGAGQPRRRTTMSTWALPLRWNAQAEAFAAQHGRRQRVFCASLADVFDNEVPDEWRADLFFLIDQTPNLDWLLLTKRVGNVERLAAKADALVARVHRSVWPMPNVRLGATITSQPEADRDITKLLALGLPNFVSMEPLLEAVDIHEYLPRCDRHPGPLDVDGKCAVCEGRGIWDTGEDLAEHEKAPIRRGLDWVIVGGESGPHARPMHPHWARSLRDQCTRWRVPFLFKQWGEWLPGENEDHPHVKEVSGQPRRVAHHQDGRWGSSTTKITEGNYVSWEPDGTMHRGPVRFGWPVAAWSERVGKKAAGRQLDGRVWDEVPQC